MTRENAVRRDSLSADNIKKHVQIPGSLPARTQTAASGKPQTRKNTHTVLLIEDDPDQLMLLRLLLEKENYRVLPAENAEQARVVLAEETVSCIVSDVFMPGTSGTEFITELRASADYTNIPIILLTAGEKSLQWDALYSGADIFCQKKDARKELAKQIRLLVM